MSQEQRRTKKIAAAVAGVMEYLRAEQAESADTRAPRPFTGFSHVNVWGMDGRRSMMQMRTLMQMRTFRGPSFRA